jgi:ornithine cyclodeaminase
MKIFDEAQIRAAVGTAAAVGAMREAFRADGLGRTVVPAVINLAIPLVDGEFHVKSAYIEGVPHVAVKVAGGFYRNRERGLPTGSGLMIVFDAETGVAEALLLDNGYLTDLRTGAAGAVAADALAPAEIETVGVIGSGLQARHQIASLVQVRRVKRLVAWSPDRAHLDAYCAEMRATLGLEATAVENPEAVARRAAVIITATPSRTPLVRAEWLRPGMHITAIGSDSPGKQELEADCLRRASLVVPDRRSQCRAFGELAHAPELAGHAQLGEIVAGTHPGRTRDDEITIADLTGVGFQDTAIASLTLRSLLNPER